ncbi:MAG TPA: hypothetical protein VGQ45_08845 [Gaiellales bacterium]|nr:hypothetical protein [Gaiellales bacterium]
MKRCVVGLVALVVTAVGAGMGSASPAWAVFPGGDGRLAFDTGGRVVDPHNIYTVNQDGTGLMQLTSDGQSSDPAWSPNGRRIAFSRRGFIFVMTSTGTSPRKVAHLGHSAQPAWSPDAKRIAFAHLGDIWTVAAAGGTPTQLTHDAATCPDSEPTWSPLGGRIAFTNGCGNVVVLRLSTGARRQITDAAGPDFTADGRGLVFASDDDLAGGVLPGPQYESSNLTGGGRTMWSRVFCAEGAPCLYGNVAASPTSTLAGPAGVFVETLDGGGFCVSGTAGSTIDFCPSGAGFPLPNHIDWQPTDLKQRTEG